MASPGPLSAFGSLATVSPPSAGPDRAPTFAQGSPSSQPPDPDAPPNLLQLSDLEVLDLIKDKLKTSLVNDIDLDVEPERFMQIANALKLCFYWQAKQYLRLGPRGDESLGFFPLGLGASTEMNTYAAFRYVYNVFRADGQKFVAVLGQRAPHVEAVPDDTEDEQSVGRASQANAVIQWLHDQWNADRLQKDVARHLWRTSSCFMRTYYNCDGGKYGWYEVPDISVENKEFGAYRCLDCGHHTPEQEMGATETCANCGAPVDQNSRISMNLDVPVNNGMKRMPRGCVEASLRTIFECSWPADAKRIADCAWFCEEYDIHKSKALAVYAPNAPSDENDQRIADIINSESDSDMTAGKQAAADAREMLLSTMVARNQRRNILRHSTYWLRPDWFDMLRAQGLDGGLASQLWQKYPKGVRITQLRGEIIKLDHASMDDEWAVFKGGLDEKILSDAVGYDVVPVQDNTNHLGNMMTETLLRGIPRTFVPAEIIDRKAIEENEPMPGEIVPYRTASAPGGNIANLIAKIPTAEMSQQAMPFMEWLREFSRDSDGAQPAIFGGGTPSQTFRSDLLRRNQALMQWQPFFDEMQSGWEIAYQNGVKQWAMYSSDVMRVPGGQLENGSEIVDPQDLLSTGWHCEADEQIPLSQAEEAQQLIEMIQQTPALAATLEVTSDQNIKRLYQIFNQRGFTSRKLQEREKFEWYLDKLLKSGPLPPPPPPPTLPGMPPPPPANPVPSIPADQFEDDHAFMAQAARDFLNSKPGLKLKAISMGFAPPRPNVHPKAYDNILAWGRAHQAQVPPAPPAPPAPPPGKPGPKPRPAAPAPPPAKGLGAGAPPTGKKLDVLTAGKAAPPPGAGTPNPPQGATVQ